MRRPLAVLGLVALVACGGGGDEVASPTTTTTKPSAVATSSSTTSTTAAEAPGPSPGCGTVEPAPGRRVEEEVPAARNPREVLVDVPPADDGRTPLPVVLQLHASGGTPDGIADMTGFTELGARDGVLVVSPEGSLQPRGWVTFTGEPHGLTFTETTFLDDLLAHLGEIRCIDEARVSVVGVSNGAAMAMLYACESAGPLVAAVAVAGLLWPGDERCDGDLPPRVGTWLGTEDRVFESFLDKTPAGCCGGTYVWPPEEVEPRWRDHVGDATWVTVEGLGHAWPRAETERIWSLLVGP